VLDFLICTNWTRSRLTFTHQLDILITERTNEIACDEETFIKQYDFAHKLHVDHPILIWAYAVTISTQTLFHITCMSKWQKSYIGEIGLTTHWKYNVNVIINQPDFHTIQNWLSLI